MQKLLIADPEPGFCTMLTSELRKDFEITVCHTGTETIEKLHSETYRVLILEMLLPEMDGLSVLQEAATMEKPPMVLALCRFLSDYLVQCLSQLPVTYLMMKPCEPKVISCRVKEIAESPGAPIISAVNPRERVSSLLISLGIPTKLKGFSCLKEAIMLMLEDPSQSVTKELYPTVARNISAATTPTQVERLMRSAIENAWAKRNETLWEQYFPEGTCLTRPSNHTFLSRIAESLSEKS